MKLFSIFEGWPATQHEFYLQLANFIDTEAGNAYYSDVVFHADKSVKVSQEREKIF